ncbi:retrovirus-related pol polyprotein from transposon TNT 1-94 [Tanacetum coccineum]
MSFITRVENQNDIHVKQLRTDNGTEFRNNILVKSCDERGTSQNFSLPYTPKQNGVAKRRNRTLIEAARIMPMDLSTIVKRHLKTPYEIFRGRLPNISFLHVFGCPIYIHNHKDHLGQFDEKPDDGYFLGYSLVSKSFRVFNTRRQQTEETFHIIFDESTKAIKYQVINNVVQFIKPYDRPKLVVTQAVASFYQHDQTIQNDKILNNDQAEHLNHTNDENIIENLTNTEYVQVTEPPSSSPNDASASNAVSTIQTETPTITPSLATPAPQDRWSRDKHIELVNIMDFLSKEEPKKVFEALKHLGWVDAIQEELN